MIPIRQTERARNLPGSAVIIGPPEITDMIWISELVKVDPGGSYLGSAQAGALNLEINVSIWGG